MIGCAGPFLATRPEPSRGEGVSVSFCGSSKITAEKVLRAMEPPSDLPSEVGGSGGLGAGKLKSFLPNTSSDVDVHPGFIDKWGLGFLINTVPYEGGRSAGSLAWAGVANTFYWIDPKRQICAALMMQFLPFVDKEAVGLLGDFERSVYAAT